MKTKNILQAIGTANITLLLLGFFFHAIIFVPDMEITFQKISTVNLFQMKTVIEIIMINLFKSLSLFAIGFGLINGVLSFWSRYDSKAE